MAPNVPYHPRRSASGTSPSILAGTRSQIGCATASSRSRRSRSPMAPPNDGSGGSSILVRRVDLVASYSNLVAEASAIERALAVPADGRGRARPDSPPRNHRIDDRLKPDVQAAVVADYVTGLPLRTIQEWHGVSRYVIRVLASRADALPRQRRATTEVARRAAELYATGLSLAAVGREIGHDAGTVLRLLERQGVPRRDTHGRPRRCSLPTSEVSAHPAEPCGGGSCSVAPERADEFDDVAAARPRLSGEPAEQGGSAGEQEHHEQSGHDGCEDQRRAEHPGRHDYGETHNGTSFRHEKSPRERAVRKTGLGLSGGFRAGLCLGRSHVRPPCLPGAVPYCAG